MQDSGRDTGGIKQQIAHFPQKDVRETEAISTPCCCSLARGQRNPWLSRSRPGTEEVRPSPGLPRTPNSLNCAAHGLPQSTLLKASSPRGPPTVGAPRPASDAGQGAPGRAQGCCTTPLSCSPCFEVGAQLAPAALAHSSAGQEESLLLLPPCGRSEDVLAEKKQNWPQTRCCQWECAG